MHLSKGSVGLEQEREQEQERVQERPLLVLNMCFLVYSCVLILLSAVVCAKSPYYLLIYMQRVRIVYSLLRKVFLL